MKVFYMLMMCFGLCVACAATKRPLLRAIPIVAQPVVTSQPRVVLKPAQKQESEKVKDIKISFEGNLVRFPDGRECTLITFTHPTLDDPMFIEHGHIEILDTHTNRIVMRKRCAVNVEGNAAMFRAAFAGDFLQYRAILVIQVCDRRLQQARVAYGRDLSEIEKKVETPLFDIRNGNPIIPKQTPSKPCNPRTPEEIHREERWHDVPLHQLEPVLASARVFLLPPPLLRYAYMEFAFNKKAKFDYELLDTFEAGISLQGFEVKSVKAGRADLTNARVIARGGEAFLIGAKIPPYQSQNTPEKYEADRPRKLLVSKKELALIADAESKKGLTVVAVSLYNKNRLIKLSFGIARGKKKFDKRESIKTRDSKRDMERTLKTRR